MPLLDHFHAPMSDAYEWTSFHAGWATVLAIAFNRQLPAGFRAAPEAKFGIEIDVATFEHQAPPWEQEEWSDEPSPRGRVETAALTDVVEVRVFSKSGGPRLAAAVELVSPADKDRPDSRAAFVRKCAGYLQLGVGVLVVDIVTELHANMHAELLRHIGVEPLPGDGGGTCVGSYRPLQNGSDGIAIDFWIEPATVGLPLPMLPLYLLRGPRLRVDLEGTYEMTRRDLRFGPPVPTGGDGRDGRTDADRDR